MQLVVGCLKSTASGDHPQAFHPIAAVIDELYRIGAASVIVAEGPGHIRDTDLLLDESGLRAQLDILKPASFVDLNFDSVTRVVPGTGIDSIGRNLAPHDGPVCGHRDLHAEDQDASLGGRHVKSQELLRNSAWLDLWLAKERIALGGHR